MNIENRKDRKELNYTKLVDGMELMMELYNALPELLPREIEGELAVNLRLFTNGYTIKLWVPADANEKIITKVVYNHQLKALDKVGEV